MAELDSQSDEDQTTAEVEGSDTPAPKPAAVSSPVEERGVLKSELDGAQAHRKGGDAGRKALSESIEAQRVGPMNRFFTGIFGKGFAATFLTKALSPWFGGVFSKEIPMDEFEKQLELAEKDASGEDVSIEDFIIAHRSLGYGKHGENSPEAIEAALNGGEKQIEIDLRLGDDGEIYVVHDSIKGESEPAGKHPKLADVLSIFANHEHQDVAIYFDIKEVGVLDKLDEAVAAVDSSMSGRDGYESLADRHFVSSFNDEILVKAHEKNPNRPLIFNYIPTAQLKNADNMVANMGHKKVKKMCATIDKTYKTSLVKDLDSTVIKIDGKPIKDSPEGAENRLNLCVQLPPKEILSKVAYIGVPLKLCTKALVEAAHKAGVKIGVWGGENKDIQYALGSLGVDMVISDTPDVIKGS